MMRLSKRLAWPALLWVLLSTLLATPVFADIIRFKDGSRFRGTVLKRTDKEVTLRLDFGTVSFSPQDILSVEPEPPPVEKPESVAPTIPQELKVIQGEDGMMRVVEEKPLPESSGEGVSDDPSGNLDDAKKAVAFIAVMTKEGYAGIGSGFAINRKGIVVTNYHVVADADRIAVAFLGEAGWSTEKKPKPYEAHVLKTDACLDLALISVGRATPQYLALAEDDKAIHVGNTARAIGNPEGLAVTVSGGIVSAIRTFQDLSYGADAGDFKIAGCSQLSGRELNKIAWVQTDAAINPGNSGGPLLNDRSEVIGINSFITTRSGGSQGLGFALHVKHIRKFAKGYLPQR